VTESGAESPLPRQLRLNLADLADVFDDPSWELSGYLDLVTGQVIRVTAHLQPELEAIRTDFQSGWVIESGFTQCSKSSSP
jgi:hypothetical protein